MADERSVDVDERRGDQAEPESGPPRLIASDTGLSPVQEAQRRRHEHASSCSRCADVDRTRCAVGEQLWRDWTTALDDAYRQLHGGAR